MWHILSLRELWRVNNALICHPILPSSTFSDSSFDLRASLLNRMTKGADGPDAIHVTGVRSSNNDFDQNQLSFLYLRFSWARCLNHYASLLRQITDSAFSEGEHAK